MTATFVEARLSKYPCGFCQSGNHNGCARTIRNGKVNQADRLWTCSCDAPECPAREFRCMDCKNTNASEINAYTMLCTDRTACKDTQAARMADNPIHQMVVKAKEKAMAENSTKTERKKAEPKVGKCLVTGEPTKGGNFLPGMDARYVSNLVKDVSEGDTTEAQAKAKIKADLGDKSGALLAKFEKSMGLAKERAAKKKEAEKAKAEAKKAAEKEKAEKAKKAAADKKAADAKK